jgi:hypothetical protein
VISLKGLEKNAKGLRSLRKNPKIKIFICEIRNIMALPFDFLGVLGGLAFFSPYCSGVIG